MGWGVPPPAAKRGAGAKVLAWMEELKSRPGEWAWRAYAKNSVYVMATRFKRAGFETAARATEGRLYVRWPVSEVKP